MTPLLLSELWRLLLRDIDLLRSMSRSLRAASLFRLMAPLGCEKISWSSLICWSILSMVFFRVGGMRMGRCCEESVVGVVCCWLCRLMFEVESNCVL